MRQVKVLQLINAYRFRGHQHVNLDPLGLWRQDRVADLDPPFHDLIEADFQEIFNVGSFASGRGAMKLDELLEALKQIYCGSIGAEYIHIISTEGKRWIQQRIEFGHATFSNEERKRFLSELTAAEGPERYLGAKFPGAKRFSLEGGDASIPMLKETIRHAGNSGTHEVVLGMTHRGHLNVLVNVLGKKPQDLFDEFTGRYKEHLGTGDVKYHMSFSSDSQTNGGLIHLVLVFDPSRLEVVSPVVTGSIHVRLNRLDEPSNNEALPVTIHGDAAVTGQGMIQETLNMSKACGYEIGGTVRIVINNQVGFTTSSPPNTRSTPYCIDTGKMVQAPIFRVGTDSPEAVVFVACLAFDFRNTFRRDTLINLVCYCRHGHNEADEPSAAQPLMYQKIKKHPTSCRTYAGKLEQEKVAMLEDATEMVNLYHDALGIGDCVVAEQRPMNMHSLTQSPYLNYEWDEEYSNKVEMKRLQELAKRTNTVPKAVEIQSCVARICGDRQTMAAGEKLFDWGSVGGLTYIILVDESIPVRLPGGDSDHGTFFHRYAVIHNQSNGSTYTSLQYTHNDQDTFRVWDPVPSEEAVLAFEYGYATAELRALTIWEAQFSDFANGTQVVID